MDKSIKNEEKTFDAHLFALHKSTVDEMTFFVFCKYIPFFR